jgi:hypothetical protein
LEGHLPTQSKHLPPVPHHQYLAKQPFLTRILEKTILAPQLALVGSPQSNQLPDLERFPTSLPSLVHLVAQHLKSLLPRMLQNPRLRLVEVGLMQSYPAVLVNRVSASLLSDSLALDKPVYSGNLTSLPRAYPL